MKNDTKTIKAIKYLLSDIKKNAISKKHRHSELNWDCAECRFRILEGGLEWYLNLLELNGQPKEKPMKGKVTKLVHSFWIKTPKGKWENLSIVKIKKSWWNLFPQIVYYLDGKEIKEIFKSK